MPRQPTRPTLFICLPLKNPTKLLYSLHSL